MTSAQQLDKMRFLDTTNVPVLPGPTLETGGDAIAALTTRASRSKTSTAYTLKQGPKDISGLNHGGPPACRNMDFFVDQDQRDKVRSWIKSPPTRESSEGK